MSESESFLSAYAASPDLFAEEEFRTAIEEIGEGGKTVERLVVGIRNRVKTLPLAAGMSLMKKAENMKEQLKDIDRVENLTCAAGLYQPDSGVTVVGVDELLAEYVETHTPEVPLDTVVSHELYHKKHKHGSPIISIAGETHGDFVIVLGDVKATQNEVEEVTTVLETGDVPAYKDIVQTITGALSDNGISRTTFIDAVNAHDMTRLNTHPTPSPPT